MFSKSLNISKAIDLVASGSAIVLAQQEKSNKRGLASSSEETRARVARAGGEAHHERRGLQAASSETRQVVARKGGLARGEQRRKARRDRGNSENRD